MNDEIFRTKKDKLRANALYETAKERLSILKFIPRDKIFKIAEEYYESIKELLTAIMYMDGYKTLSHVKLIEYVKSNYKIFNDSKYKLIDDLRKIRHGIMYYGRKVNESFLINNEKDIKLIINILRKLVEDKLNKS